MPLVRCLGCGPKPSTEFGKDPRKRSGLKSRCIACTSEQIRTQRRARGVPEARARIDAEGRVWCPKCEAYLDRAAFSPCPKRAHGVRPYCRGCTKNASRQYAEPPEQRRARDERTRDRINELRVARFWAKRGVPTVGDVAELRRPDDMLTPEEREERDDLRALWAEVSDLWLMRGQMVAYQAHLAAARFEDDAEIVTDARERRPDMSTAEHQRANRRAA